MVELLKILHILLFSLVACEALKCYCNEKYRCDERQCQTDGKCRAWIKKLPDDSIRRTFHCIDKDKLFPPERPFACENSAAVEHRYLQQCCDSGDLCNLNISLSFAADGDSVNKDTVGDVEDKRTIYIVITVLACLVMILTTGCFIYIVRLSRAGGPGSGILCSLPCVSQYTEVESKSCDAISTTTIQVRTPQFSHVSIIFIISLSGSDDDDLLGLRVWTAAASPEDSGEAGDAEGVHWQGPLRGGEARRVER